jgi:hypothetical protein
MQETSKLTCSKIEELTNTILANERVLDDMYINYKEQEGVTLTVDFATMGQLEVQNRLMREELNTLCNK